MVQRKDDEGSLRWLLQESHASNSLLPEGIENVPPRFAINWRNEWMLKQASFVVTYVTHSWGGAAKFADKATRLKKTVINLSEMNSLTP